MKRKFFILLILLLGGLMVSCQDDIILPEEESTILITDIDALRSVKPTSTTSGRPNGAIHDGEKGRDHRDWFEVFENSRIKDLEKDITQLELGDLYAIDPDGVNKFIFKFYFPEEYRESAKKYEGKRVWVNLYYRTGFHSQMFIQKLFETDSFSLDDSFLVSRYDRDNSIYFERDNIYYGYFIEYSFDAVNEPIKETTFNDLFIIKVWH